MKNRLSLLAIASSLAASATIASAAPTQTDSFGSLPGATFGGTGISSAAVETATVTGLQNGDTLTLGLTGTPFGPGPGVPLPNNNNGTFFATPGPAASNPARATWNFDYFIGINNSSDLGNYTFKLLYTDGTTSGFFDPVAVANHDGGKSVTTTTREDSENIEFLGYNINNTGTYNFDLEAFDVTGAQVGNDVINVQVAAVPDATSTLALAGIGLAGLLMVSRKYPVAVSR
jgi:hypothetical protein